MDDFDPLSFCTDDELRGFQIGEVDLSMQLDRMKESFLWAAAKGCRAEEVESLLNIGADVNWVSPEGDTALIAACRAPACLPTRGRRRGAPARAEIRQRPPQRRRPAPRARCVTGCARPQPFGAMHVPQAGTRRS
ncbi:hypothetical protein M885DRAFT_547822 [Pelagophyceae sp. CCMP2097]|nr:hypothetical protein M885DRAFT_547822 [Pelagophyceae sp. CCMP2097]